MCYQGIILSQQMVMFRDPISNISALSTKDIFWSKSKFSPTISFILRQKTNQVQGTKRRRAWKIRKRCQGSGSRAKYVATKRVCEDRLETGRAGKGFSANTGIQRFESEW